MQRKTHGLIIKEQTIGESDRLITILTRDAGVIRAFARKAKHLNDSKNAATQLLCYSRLNIYEGREKYIINDAFPLEVFFDLRTNITKLALAQYFCELAAELAPEGVDSSELLRVVLNAIHFLCNGKKTEAMLKAIVEMRMMSFAGYMPNLLGCEHCGVYEAPHMHFKINKGRMYCDDCYIETDDEPCVSMGSAAVKALRHIALSDFDKLFAFQLSENASRELSRACEAYTLSVVQRRLQTLDFYDAIR